MRIRSGGLASGRFMRGGDLFEKPDSTLEIEGERGCEISQSEGTPVGLESPLGLTRLFQGDSPASPGPGGPGTFCEDLAVEVGGHGPMSGQLGECSGQFEVMQVGSWVGRRVVPDLLPGEGRVAGPGEKIDEGVTGSAVGAREVDPGQKERLGRRKVPKSHLETSQGQADGSVPWFEGQCRPEAENGTSSMSMTEIAPGFEELDLNLLRWSRGRGGVDVKGLGAGHGREGGRPECWFSVNGSG